MQAVATEQRYNSKIMQDFYRFLFDVLDWDLFERHTVHEFLWGYRVNATGFRKRLLDLLLQYKLGDNYELGIYVGVSSASVLGQI